MNRTLLIGGSIACLAIFAIGVFWFWPPNVPVATADDGRPVAEAFLNQIRQGQVDAAWESTTAEFKSDEGREQFRQFVAQSPLLKQPLEFAEYQATSLNGLPRGQCLYRHSPTEGSSAGRGETASVRVVLARETDTWKVDGVFVD
jgi:hypothetical protein